MDIRFYLLKVSLRGVNPRHLATLRGSLFHYARSAA